MSVQRKEGTRAALAEEWRQRRASEGLSFQYHAWHNAPPALPSDCPDPTKPESRIFVVVVPLLCKMSGGGATSAKGISPSSVAFMRDLAGKRTMKKKDGWDGTGERREGGSLGKRERERERERAGRLG